MVNTAKFSVSIQCRAQADSVNSSPICVTECSLRESPKAPSARIRTPTRNCTRNPDTQMASRLYRTMVRSQSRHSLPHVRLRFIDHGPNRALRGPLHDSVAQVQQVCSWPSRAVNDRAHFLADCLLRTEQNHGILCVEVMMRIDWIRLARTDSIMAIAGHKELPCCLKPAWSLRECDERPRCPQPSPDTRCRRSGWVRCLISGHACDVWLRRA